MADSNSGSLSKPLPAQRILVVRYRFIGDTILTAPFLRNLRRAYPEATVDVLVGPQSGTVLQGCPYINELIVFDTTRFHKYDRGAGPRRNLISYATDLRKRRYDLAFILKRSWSSGLLTWLAGARYRVGYNTEGRRIFLTHPVAWNPSKHEVESTLDVLAAAGVPVVDKHLEAWVTEGEKAEISALVPELGRDSLRLLIHAAAAHPAKMYPLDNWCYVVRALAEKLKATLYFTGAEQDRELYEQLCSISGVKGINLAGKLSIRQSLALYSRMDLAVCVDSGPAHLAAAAGVPTVAIFGPTDPDRWRPWGDEHTYIRGASAPACACAINNVCADLTCLTQLDASVVVERASKLFFTNGNLPRHTQERLAKL